MSFFWRLRIGVGHPNAGARNEVVDYVLHRANAEEEDRILASIGDSLDVLPAMIELGPARAQHRLHSPKATADDTSEDQDDGNPDR